MKTLVIILLQISDDMLCLR